MSTYFTLDFLQVEYCTFIQTSYFITSGTHDISLKHTLYLSKLYTSLRVYKVYKHR